VFGGDWVKTGLPQMAEKAKVSTKNFKEFTFSDYVCCLGGLKEIKGIDLTLELGPDWEQQLRALIAIRNRCAHSLEEEVGEVPRLFRDLNTAVPMYYKLRAALHRMERNA
jgi:hypothetical protein